MLFIEVNSGVFGLRNGDNLVERKLREELGVDALDDCCLWIADRMEISL